MRGGIETYTYEAGKRVVQLGYEVVVFSMGHYGDVPRHVEEMRVIKVPIAYREPPPNA